MKLCIDCKFVSDIPKYGCTRYCNHQQAYMRTDLVTGMKFYITAHEMRYDRAICGSEGKLFEAKDATS